MLKTPKPFNKNRHPHKEAIAATWLFRDEYSSQDGGCVDFYDGLSAQRRSQCGRCVTEIDDAAEREG